MEALRLQEFDRLRDSRMIDRAENNIVAALPVCQSAAFDRQIDRFGSARSKNDFLWRSGVDEARHLFASFIEGGANFNAAGMDGAGASKSLREPWTHRFENCRFHGRSGKMIEANALHLLMLPQSNGYEQIDLAYKSYKSYNVVWLSKQLS
jgi:hypothetical protein